MAIRKNIDPGFVDVMLEGSTRTAGLLERLGVAAVLIQLEWFVVAVVPGVGFVVLMILVGGQNPFMWRDRSAGQPQPRDD